MWQFQHIEFHTLDDEVQKDILHRRIAFEGAEASQQSATEPCELVGYFEMSLPLLTMVE
jgi:hypothetical protein